MKTIKFRFGTGFRVGVSNERSQSAQIVLDPGESEGGKGNRHRGADQWLYVVAGRGVAIVNDKRISLVPGTLLLIEKGENHEIRNTGENQLCTVNIYVPPAYTTQGDPLPRAKP